MKKLISKHKNIIFGFGLLVIGVALGIGTITYQPLLAGFIKSKLQLQPVTPVKTIDEAEEKKQALGKYYNEIITAQNSQNWKALYQLVPQSVRDNVTEEQFSNHYSEQFKKDKIFSQETIVNKIEITNNSGTVYRTLVTCLAKDCTGKNRTEESAEKPYELVNGKWQIPDPKPSERALKVTNYGYENSSKSDQKDLLGMYGYGSESSSFAIRNWSVYLDKNLEELVRVETLVEQDKAEKSRPVVNYQPPAINYQPPAIIQQPATQPNYPRNCTSSTIGTYTYTNCY